MYETPKYLSAGDGAIVIELGDAISEECNRRVHALRASIASRSFAEILDIIPSYRSVLVQFAAAEISIQEMEARLRGVEEASPQADADTRVIEIPVLYGGEYGPDLDFVARNAGISADEVVSIHSEPDYPVYMMGFTPGFPYLGGMSERIAAPRLETPRGVIPAGSVGIAELQTGVYPIESPGGWRLIGRTPLRLFDPRRAPPSLLDAGDCARFVPVASEGEYLRLLALEASPTGAARGGARDSFES